MRSLLFFAFVLVGCSVNEPPIQTMEEAEKAFASSLGSVFESVSSIDDKQVLTLEKIEEVRREQKAIRDEIATLPPPVCEQSVDDIAKAVLAEFEAAGLLDRLTSTASCPCDCDDCACAVKAAKALTPTPAVETSSPTAGIETPAAANTAPAPAGVLSAATALKAVADSHRGRNWTYPGSIDGHLASTHGVSASQTAGMSQRDKERLHSAIHEGANVLATPVPVAKPAHLMPMLAPSETLVSDDGVPVSGQPADSTVSSGCPNGVCPVNKPPVSSGWSGFFGNRKARKARRGK